MCVEWKMMVNKHWTSAHQNQTCTRCLTMLQNTQKRCLYLLLLLSSIKKVTIFADQTVCQWKFCRHFQFGDNLFDTVVAFSKHWTTLSNMACMSGLVHTHKTPAQPRDSGRWLNQRIIRSTIFKPPQDWQIIIYTSTSKIFWEISAVSTLDCGQLRVAGLGWAKRRSRENRDIFISVYGANINKYGRNIHLFCPGLRHRSSKLIQTPNFPFPHSYITPHTD